MDFPVIHHPTYDIKVPSTKKTEKFRPFLVKEEKLLLTARESGDLSDALAAVKRVVQNCSLSQTPDRIDARTSLNVDTLPLFDLEYLFLKIRAFSVNSTVQLSYKDAEDDKVRDFEVDLNNVEVEFPEKADPVVKLSETTGIVLRYPPASLYGDKTFPGTGDYLFELVKRCIERVYEGDTVLEAPFDQKELETFLDSLDVKTFTKIQDFLAAAPRMRHTIKYTNDLGHERKIELSSLNDFFTFV